MSFLARVSRSSLAYPGLVCRSDLVKEIDSNQIEALQAKTRNSLLIRPKILCIHGLLLMTLGNERIALNYEQVMS